MNPSQTITASTEVGDVELQVQHSGAVVQVNCLMPPAGPGFFVAFPHEQLDQAIEAAKALAIKARTMPDESQNITEMVPGCLAAGTVPRLRVQFGIPDVSRAE